MLLGAGGLVLGCAEAHPSAPSDAGRDAGASWAGEVSRWVFDDVLAMGLLVDSHGRLCATLRHFDVDGVPPVDLEGFLRYGCFDDDGVFREIVRLASGRVSGAAQALDANDRVTAIVFGDRFEVATEHVEGGWCLLRDVGTTVPQLQARCGQGWPMIRSMAQSGDRAVGILRTEAESARWNGVELPPYSVAVVDDLVGTPRIVELHEVPRDLGTYLIVSDGTGGFAVGGHYLHPPSEWRLPPTFEQRAFVLRLDPSLAVTSSVVSSRVPTLLGAIAVDDEGTLVAIASDFTRFDEQHHAFVSGTSEDAVFGRGARVVSVTLTHRHMGVLLSFGSGARFETDGSRVEATSRHPYVLVAVTRDGRFVRAWPSDQAGLQSNVVALPDGTFAMAVGGTLRVLSPD